MIAQKSRFVTKYFKNIVMYPILITNREIISEMDFKFTIKEDNVMGMEIYQNYSQFYKGTESLKSYGTDSASKKDTLVKYEFNTTDEKGNKVMDKMSKEETFRTMNEISSYYGDNVIVEFSGDALTALEQHGKGLLKEPEADREPVPTTPLEGPHAFTEEEWKEINTSKLGDDMEAIMRDVDPKAYGEYQRISKEGMASGTQKGMTAGFRYLVDWMEKKRNANINWIEEYKDSQKTGTDTKVKSEGSGLSEKAAAFLAKLRKTYGKFDFFVGDAGDARSLMKNSNKEFSVLFSTEELEKMAADEKYAAEKMNAVNDAVRMSQQINKQFGFESAGNGVKITKMSISFNSDGTTSFFAELEKSSASQREHIEKEREDKRTQRKVDAKKAEKEKQQERLKGNGDHVVKRTTVQAESMEELLKKIRETDWNDSRTGNIPETGRKFDFSI